MISESLYIEELVSLVISGPDARDFLHRLTTQDIKTLDNSEKRNAALLRANSQIMHLFSVEFKDNSFFISTEKSRAQNLVDELEKMHFAEDLKIEILNESLSPPHLKLSEDDRINKGLFKFGVDITDKNLILEAPLNSFVHRNKGCYPGQEVVERVFTYGQMAKKLVGISLKAGSNVKPGDSVSVDGKKVGTATSATSSVALAMIQKPTYAAGSKTDQGEVFLLQDSF